MLFRNSKAHGLYLGLSLVSFFMLTSCSSLQNSEPSSNLDDALADFSVPSSKVLFATPDPAASFRDESLIVNLSLALDTQARTRSERAKVFYELGIIYDRLGMEATARYMFMNAITEQPKFSDAYDFLGVYFSQNNQPQEAYDAFDSALELNPGDVYAHLNRAIALYYAHRSSQALADITVFFNDDPNDPYRMLWMYLIERQNGSQDAQGNLRRRFEQADQSRKDNAFGFDLVKLYLGKISEGEFFDILRKSRFEDNFSDMLCEGYYYLGKLKELSGQRRLYLDYLKLAAATSRHGFLEYRNSIRELQNAFRPLVDTSKTDLFQGAE